VSRLLSTRLLARFTTMTVSSDASCAEVGSTPAIRHRYLSTEVRYGNKRGLRDRILVVSALKTCGIDQSMTVLHVEIVTEHIKVPPRADAHPACSVPAPERILIGLESGFCGVEYDGVSAQKTCGVKAPFPGFIEPELATSIDKVPSGECRIHEIKFDGYRVQVHLRDAVVKVFTRRGNDWTNRFRKIAGDAWHIDAGSAIIDGEAVVPSADGTTDFSVLQNELKGRSKKIVMVAFDLLYFNGYDLRKLPLSERKALLQKIIAKTDTARASRSTVARCTSTPARPAMRASSRRSATAVTSRVESTIG
jgi:hypothetical protein